MIERIAAIARDVDVGKTIIVVVRDGDAHAPAFASQTRLLRDVGELEIGVLVVERHHGIATLLAVTVDVRTVDHDDVQFAVVVAVDQANAAAHRLDDVALIGRRDVRDRQTGLLGDVFEMGQGGGSRLFSGSRSSGHWDREQSAQTPDISRGSPEKGRVRIGLEVLDYSPRHSSSAALAASLLKRKRSEPA